MKIATYTIENNRKIFSGEIDAVELVEDGKSNYFAILNSTFTLPTLQANENQNLVLENEGTEKEEWILQEKVLQGTFYEKDSGKMETEIFVSNIDKYTEILPLQQYEDGTMQAFNDTLQKWEYTKKGEILLRVELAEQLENAKIDRLKQLENDWQASKLIIIQDANIIRIEHDTKERKIFLENVEFVKNETTKSNTVLSYRQIDKENKCRYSISLVCYIWKYLFADLFLIARSSGFEESIRSKNEGEYTLTKLKIENAKTIDELSTIFYDFVKPQGIVIDINEKAKQMLNDPNFDYASKEIIKKTMDKDGKINLIKKTDI